jgi:hypothetical protein
MDGKFQTPSVQAPEKLQTSNSKSVRLDCALEKAPVASILMAQRLCLASALTETLRIFGSWCFSGAWTLGIWCFNLPPIPLKTARNPQMRVAGGENPWVVKYLKIISKTD